MRLEISKTRISRVIHGDRLGIPNCLVLADLLTEDPAIVLRAYGYGRHGAILHGLYTRLGYTFHPNADIFHALERLQSDDRRFVAGLITTLSAVRGMDVSKGGAR